MPDIQACNLSTQEQQLLLDVARRSVHYGLAFRRPMGVQIDQYPPSLAQPCGTFVTLNLMGQLRGCIGRLESTRPLVEDVAENAFGAAYYDRRFTPVAYHELDLLEYHISILTPPQPMIFGSQDELEAQLRPGVDGLILEDAGHRGTFLPAVWETLPDPETFLAHLKRKAGLPVDHWSSDVKVWRYETVVVE